MTKTTLPLKRRLARLTPAEDAAWDVAWEFYMNGTQRLTDDQGAEKAWRDIQGQFPRLKAFDGCHA